MRVVDGAGAGGRPVLRVDVPVDRPHPEAAGGGDDAGVDGAARRAEEAGLEVGVGLDPLGGAGDLRVAGEFDVVHRVVADLVAFGEDLAHRGFAPGISWPISKKVPWTPFSRSTWRKPGVYSLGPSSKVRATTLRSRGPLVSSPAVPPVQPTARTGRSRKPSVFAGRSALGAAPPRGSSRAREHPPAVAVGDQAGVAGNQRHDQLLEARPLHRRADAALPGRPALRVDQLQADPAVRLRPAEAEPALAGRPCG